MRRLLIIGGVGLCLGLTGCASTQQGVALGPGGGVPGARPTPVAHSLPQPHVHCGCGPVQLPGPPPAILPPPAPEAATPPATTLARFFPLLNELDGATPDPLETVRPDPLGVRTTASYMPTGLRDGRMVRASADERQSDLPLIMKITPPPDGASPASVTSVDVIEPSPATLGPAREIMPVAADAPPDGALGPPGPPLQQPGGAIALEYADDPALAGRPRLSSDGTMIPRPRAAGDPTRYGPDPTFPASYSADGSALTSVPKTREVWPTWQPWRPTLLSRMFQRFRKPDGTKPTVPGPGPGPGPVPGPGSAQREPRDLAKRGQGVERIAVNRPDEPAQR